LRYSLLAKTKKVKKDCDKNPSPTNTHTNITILKEELKRGGELRHTGLTVNLATYLIHSNDIPFTQPKKMLTLPTNHS
jgi:hypothetical protein